MAAAGGFADFLAASHISLNVGPASVSSEELTRSLSEATIVSRSSHFEVKAFFFRAKVFRVDFQLESEGGEGWVIGDFGAREIYRRILASTENDTEVVLQAARGVDGQEQSALEGSIFRVSKDA